MLALLVGFVTASEEKVELPLFGKIDEDNAVHYYDSLQDGQRPPSPSFFCLNVSVQLFPSISLRAGGNTFLDDWTVVLVPGWRFETLSPPETGQNLLKKVTWESYPLPLWSSYKGPIGPQSRRSVKQSARDKIDRKQSKTAMASLLVL